MLRAQNQHRGPRYLGYGLPLLLWALLTTAFIPIAFASSQSSDVGLVCVSNTATSCPTTLATFTGRIGSQLTVNVVIQDSGPFDGYNIFVGANPSILNPVSVSVQGAVLQDASYMVCINQEGPQPECRLWLNNGPGVVQVLANGRMTEGRTTGLLFSVTYDIVGRTYGTGIHIFSQVSPSGWACYCVFIHTPDGWVLSENIQGANFFNALVGDMNDDCDVDIFDIAIVGHAYGSTTGSERWNPKADLDGDGNVDIFDVAEAAMNYGRTCA